MSYSVCRVCGFVALAFVLFPFSILLFSLFLLLSFSSFVHVGRVAVSVNRLGETRPVPANQFTKAKAYDVKPPRQCLAPVLISGQTNDGPFVALGAAILVHANGPIEGNPGPLWLSSTATTAKNQGKVTTLAPRHPMHRCITGATTSRLRPAQQRATTWLAEFEMALDDLARSINLGFRWHLPTRIQTA